jgi:hypothetical protein
VLLAVLSTAGLLASVAHAEESTTLLEAFTKGKPILSFRYRYENVNDDAFDKEAHSSTLRTVLGYKTQTWKGLGLHIEAENVSSIGNDLYNNIGYQHLNNGVRDRPVVADPAITDVLQTYLWFEKNGSFAQLGREIIKIDDERFVGPVGWRQHFQTFNAFKFTNKSLEWANFLYSYIDKVHRINGATWDTSSNLFHAGFKLGKVGKLTPYAYLLDFENQPQLGLSSASYGLELTGRHELGGNKSLNFEAEYATQSDFGDNPNNLSADSLFVMVQGVFEPLSVKLGYEVLGRSEQDGQFSTPLATLHKFNGWADKFLRTPTDGLKDLYLTLNGKIGPVKWLATYHDFSAESTSTDYGGELDFLFLYSAPWKQGFGFKGALYSADEFSTDTNKFWVFTTYKI